MLLSVIVEKQNVFVSCLIFIAICLLLLILSLLLALDPFVRQMAQLLDPPLDVQHLHQHGFTRDELFQIIGQQMNHYRPMNGM